MRIGGPDQIDLVDTKIVAYAKGEAESDKTQEADDMMKAIVRENMGDLAGLTVEGRPRRFPADHFYVDPYMALAPSFERAFSWRRVLPVLGEITETSRHLGTPLYFDVIPVGDGQFTFRTFINVRGIDRSLGGGLQPIVFSKEAGTLAEPFMRIDYIEERNYVYGGGPGEGTDRLIDTENDLPRIYSSIWNRREDFQDAREETTALGVGSRAFQHMEDMRPKLVFRGQLIDTPRTRFGVDWGFGDIVSARYRGRTIDGLVKTMRIAVAQDQTEDLSAGLEVERAFG